MVGVAFTRSLTPTSAATATYVCAVAPERSAQALPFTSQRIHWYVKEVEPPLHDETLAVRVEPAWAVPVIAGFHAPAPLAPAVVIARTARATATRVRCGRRMLPLGSARPRRLPSLELVN